MGSRGARGTSDHGKDGRVAGDFVHDRAIGESLVHVPPIATDVVVEWFRNLGVHMLGTKGGQKKIAIAVVLEPDKGQVGSADQYPYGVIVGAGLVANPRQGLAVARRPIVGFVASRRSGEAAARSSEVGGLVGV